MTELITNWLANTFTADPHFLTAIISIIPTIEVRGAITLGISLGLNPWAVWALSCVSALVVCPILLLCLAPILRLLKKIKIFSSLAEGLEKLFVKKAEKILYDSFSDEEKNNAQITNKKIYWRETLGVFLFVAIPLPLTGVWTGSAVASFLDLPYKYSFLAIIVGNFISGLVILLLNIIMGEHAPLIFLVLLVFVIVSIVSLCIAVFVKNKEKSSIQKESRHECDNSSEIETK